jgi:hypothetical protein
MVPNTHALQGFRKCKAEYGPESGKNPNVSLKAGILIDIIDNLIKEIFIFILSILHKMSRILNIFESLLELLVVSIPAVFKSRNSNPAAQFIRICWGNQ